MTKIKKLIIYRVLVNGRECFSSNTFEGYQYPTPKQVVDKINEIIDYLNEEANDD